MLPIYPGKNKPTSFLSRTEKSNKNRLEELGKLGLLGEFKDYQGGVGLAEKTFKTMKSLGSGALDVIQRGEYATAGAADVLYSGGTGGEAIERAGQELASGIGDIKGKKETIPDVLKQHTGYREFAEENPKLSMATDFALSVGLDPTTYVPAVAFSKANKIVRGGVKTVTKPLRNTKTYEKIAGTLGRTFDTSYLWKKGAGKIAGQKGFDIMWDEGNFATALRNKLKKGIEPQAEKVATWEPDKIKNFIKVMYGDVDAIPLSDDVSEVAVALKTQLRHIGSRESKYAGKGTEWLLEDYFPNSAKQLTEFAENIGEYLPTGHNRGLALWKTTSDRQKVLRTGDDFLGWLKTIGVKDDDLAEVVTRNLMGRAETSANKIRNIRMTNRLVKELPDVFEEVPFGTKKVFQLSKDGEPIVRPGNTLWMPSGNLRFFKINLQDIIPEQILKSIEDSGGRLTSEMVDKIDDAIEMATKTVVKTTESGGIEAVGPLKKLEAVVTGALEARGMSTGEASVYVKKLKSGVEGGLSTIEKTTSVDKKLLSNYIKSLITALGETGGKLDPSVLDKLNRTVIGVSTKVKAYQVPVEIIEDITKASTRLGNPDTMWKYYDKMLNVFKNTAILSPFFHNRNFMSSGFQNYLADVSPTRYADALSVFRTAKKTPNKIIKGKSASGWIKLMERNGILGGSFVGQQVGKTGIPGVESVFKANRAIGTSVENISRAPLFMDRILKGDSPLEAAKMVKKFHFDYGELTDFERGTMKRLMPFYSWTRKNIPLQLEMLMKAPKKYLNISKLKNAVRGGPEGKLNPDWWKEQDVWETKFQDKDGNKMAIAMGLPYSDLNSVFTNPTGSLGPAGALGSLISNYDPFYQEKIKEFPGQTMTAIQVGSKEINVDPRLVYGIEHVAPAIKRYGTDLSKEISMLAAHTDKPDTFYKVLSKVIGVRLLPLTKNQEDKKRIYDLRRDLDNYRKYLKQEE